ncbi:prolipoprotein diacylglyceryl transferase [Collinsella sp. AGMB00827]|uniref:Phosphatidylglycerol--prolipoprotein diacylglyceryl transferase n=1 Tax=Collinsella ureilytica TaxID=2869515 RepID=A0ABS7MLF0_9ACTN|nr:prolipoprotein diacylglyceryl transferase [Collinsella urealyticum]MBY4798207.1 prolipoprotein diacylglyceryl transferase [Collinsella urealyticum]
MLNDLYHALDPVAFSAGPITIYWYGLAYIVGAVLTGIVMYRTQRRWGLGLTIDDIWTVVSAVVFGLIIGARLFYVVFYGEGLDFYLQHPLEIIAVNHGGMSFHGGLVGGVLAGIVACRSLGIAPGTMADLTVIGVPIALMLGRCANFVNGELWGKPTDLPWGVVFGGAAGSMPRHPSQLYEAFLEGLVLFLLLQVLSRRRPLPPQGTFMGTFVLGYGIARILVEFVRVPDAQLGYLIGGVITMGQILSLPLVIVGIVLIVVAARAKRPQVGSVAG